MMAYVIFMAIHTIILITSINMTNVAMAFPEITTTFNVSLVVAGWVLSVYLLVATASAVLFGKVSEIFGRKRTCLFCTSLFFVGSLVAAVSPNIWLLIFARLIQSIGAGGIVPSMVGVVMELFPRNRQRAFGISMGFFNLGGIIGPSIGAWLVSSWGWRSIFWFNIPLVLLACIPIILWQRDDPGQKSRIDYAGIGYFTGGLFAIMIALAQIKGENSGFGWVAIGLLFVIGLVLIYIFWRHEFKTPQPLIDLNLLRLKPFVASNFYNIIFGFCVFGLSSLIPLYAMSVYNLDMLQTGVVMSVRSIGCIVATIVSSAFVIRLGYRWPMLIGSILISVCVIILGIEPRQSFIPGYPINEFVLLNVINLVLGIGTGIAIPASFNCCVDMLPSKVSQITGVQTMLRQAGGAVSIAVITLLLQGLGNMVLGFGISFVATGLFALLLLPFIFVLPAKPVPALKLEETAK
jgi:MFS family permease